MASEHNEFALLAQISLKVTRLTSGELNVSIDQVLARTLNVRDIMTIQQAVELKFFELLASLSEPSCPSKRPQKR